MERSEYERECTEYGAEGRQHSSSQPNEQYPASSIANRLENPTSSEKSMDIEERRIRKVKENLAAAKTLHPELLERDPRMIYINTVVNGTHKMAYVDSGAGTSKMSLWFAEEIGMKDLIDSRYRKRVTGLAAENRSVGQLHACPVRMQGLPEVTHSFSVYDHGRHLPALVIGRKFLTRYECTVDLNTNKLAFGDGSTRILNLAIKYPSTPSPANDSANQGNNIKSKKKQSLLQRKLTQLWEAMKGNKKKEEESQEQTDRNTDLKFASKHKHQQKLIDKTLTDAKKANEGCFDSSKSLTISCRINGCSANAIIDTGAEVTAMSAKVAQDCGLFELIDTRLKIKCRSVVEGTQNTLGRIHFATIEMGEVKIPSSVFVFQKLPGDFLIGLDVLRRFKCVLDLKQRTMAMGSSVVKLPTYQ